MRGTVRIPIHHAQAKPPAPPAEDEAERFVGRACYVFNPSLRATWDDTQCSHCRFYLTARCPHIDEFLDDVEEMTPE